MRVIINNTVLSNFASVGKLDLLRRLFKTVYTTNEVHQEILTGIAAGYRFLIEVDKNISFGIGENGWIEIKSIGTKEEHLLSDNLRQMLHAGEATCIAVAKFQNLVFLSDDLKAREIAYKKKIKVSGTIGILGHCIRKHIVSLPEADEILKDMIKKGYRSPIRSLEEILKI